MGLTLTSLVWELMLAGDHTRRLLGNCNTCTCVFSRILTTWCQFEPRHINEMLSIHPWHSTGFLHSLHQSCDDVSRTVVKFSFCISVNKKFLHRHMEVRKYCSVRLLNHENSVDGRLSNSQHVLPAKRGCSHEFMWHVTTSQWNWEVNSRAGQVSTYIAKGWKHLVFNSLQRARMCLLTWKLNLAPRDQNCSVAGLHDRVRVLQYADVMQDRYGWPLGIDPSILSVLTYLLIDRYPSQW